MKQLIKKYWFNILCGICAIWAIFSLANHSIPKSQIVYTTDTVFYTKTDTLELTSPIFVSKRIVDTFFVFVNDTTKVSLPIEQKRYSEPDKYDIYVSGVNPNLDTVRVFNKTEYQTITNNITKTIYKHTWKGYIGGQISTFDGMVIPSVNLMLISPKSFAFGGGIGLYQNKPIYNLSVSYKIFEK